MLQAIEILQKNEKGYFLFVEAGKIDQAHHLNRANIAMNEFAAFEQAVTVSNHLLELKFD